MPPRPPATAAGEPLVPIGELTGAHGVGGEARLRLFNPASSLLEESRALFLLGPGEAPRPLGVLRARPHGNVWLVTLDGVASPEAARALAGRAVAVLEKALPPLGAGEFYTYQLVGLEAVDETGRVVGSVREVISAGGNDVLAVDTPDGERLVPMVETAVREVDLAARRVTLRLADEGAES